MKQKEKAIELINKFKEYADEEYHECSLQYDLNKARENNAKQCALIAVNELIEDGEDREQSNINYWIEVKIEIENL